MAALPWGGAPEAASPPPALKGPQSGGYYRFAVGDAEDVVISDGALSFQPIQPTWAPEATKEELEAALRSAFLPTDRISLQVNDQAMKMLEKGEIQDSTTMIGLQKVYSILKRK